MGYKSLLKGSIASFDQLAAWGKEKGFQIEPELSDVVERYPMRVNPYFLNLIEKEGDPIWKQAIPDKRELRKQQGLEADPLNEEKDSPVPLVVRRYPDRALLEVTNVCPMYCRFCTRKRKIGKSCENPTQDELDNAIEYLMGYRGKDGSVIRDVIISGGDPLMLSTERIEYVLGELNKIPHLEIIRIGTRVPSTFPQRILEDTGLVALLKRYRNGVNEGRLGPILYINTHFNHPSEFTQESREACLLLADLGIPLGDQTVLLHGVNDDPKTMRQLMQELLKVKVKPYYIYFPDPVEGTGHFKVSIERGLEIMESLRGHTSGLAVPQLIIDGPGGKGKTPLTPNYVVRRTPEGIVMRNYLGNLFIYPDQKVRRRTDRTEKKKVSR